jgi:NADH-quinone oxidoreductase subunit N
MLIGVVAMSQLGMASVVFYLIGYLLTNLAAFGVVAAFWQVEKTDEITAYAGLSRRAPGLALVLMVAFLSLAGMPPLVGFVAKVFVFAAAVQSGYIWLAVIGVLNSIVGLYYYLTVLKVVYLYRSDKDEVPVPIAPAHRMALTVLTIGIILLGIVFAPWYNWSLAIASSMF